MINPQQIHNSFNRIFRGNSYHSMMNVWYICHKFTRKLWQNYRKSTIFRYIPLQYPSQIHCVQPAAFPSSRLLNQFPPTPKLFPQSRQAGCFLPIENSHFSTLEPQTPCTRSAYPQSRPVRASAPTPGWAFAQTLPALPPWKQYSLRS